MMDLAVVIRGILVKDPFSVTAAQPTATGKISSFSGHFVSSNM